MYKRQPKRPSVVLKATPMIIWRRLTVTATIFPYDPPFRKRLLWVCDSSKHPVWSGFSWTTDCGSYHQLDPSFLGGSCHSSYGPAFRQRLTESYRLWSDLSSKTDCDSYQLWSSLSSKIKTYAVISYGPAFIKDWLWKLSAMVRPFIKDWLW